MEKIRKSCRYVDLIFGTHNIFKLAELVSVLERRTQNGQRKQGKNGDGCGCMEGYRTRS